MNVTAFLTIARVFVARMHTYILSFCFVCICVRSDFGYFWGSYIFHACFLFWYCFVLFLFKEEEKFSNIGYISEKWFSILCLFTLLLVLGLFFFFKLKRYKMSFTHFVLQKKKEVQAENIFSFREAPARFLLNIVKETVKKYLHCTADKTINSLVYCDRGFQYSACTL